MSTSLHVSAKIHAFFGASRDLGFGISCQRAAKIPSSLAGVVRDRRGIHMRHLSYLVYYLTVFLWSHNKIM